MWNGKLTIDYHIPHMINNLAVTSNIRDNHSFPLNFQTNCGVANLVDRYLGHLYPEYVEHTRSVLIRQARDLLVCTFHGDLTKFEEDFLAPAAIIIDAAKRSCCTSETVSRSQL